ncbi:paraquat-inducible protein A [Aliiroseovarius sp. KMU-50]|uniref:Paraquat-inducible protein A n=1 Tax=Aliiroseovarius salicola TaxID=3009082 RepID=A0ABT4W1I5_9RHOB|nr:paraquat-inducible protein A [Aliiroseovarius sp. KMU-50]MDA5094374.1 paraquat-inducible protein A [Aliiroseovarius sp. KMU-50]
MRYMRYLNLALLIAFPLSWFAPLMRAGLNLPFFGTDEISVISGLQTLWQKDVFIALLVTFFALIAPLVKSLGLALIQFGQMRRKMLPVFNVMGKLAMADIFLVALYIVIVKGVTLAKIEVAWGLYLFSACILISLGISLLMSRKAKPVSIIGK